MRNGKLKWFNSDKGYGFIIPDDGGPDIFVHKRDLASSGIRDLRKMIDGVELRFRDEDNPNGKGGKIARWVELVG